MTPAGLYVNLPWMRTFMDSVKHNERGNQMALAKRIGSSPRAAARLP